MLILSFSRSPYLSIQFDNIYQRPFDLKITSNGLHIRTFMYLYDTKCANIAPIYIVVANQKDQILKGKRSCEFLCIVTRYFFTMISNRIRLVVITKHIPTTHRSLFESRYR